MINKIFIIIMLPISLFCDIHYAKMEPIETVTLKAEASGKAVKVMSELEGKVVNGVIVQIDDKINKLDLKHSKESLNLINKMIKLNEDMLPILKKNLDEKKRLYLKIAPLYSSSENQKNNLYSAYISAKTQYSSTQEKILNLKSQKVTLEQKIAQLEDLISKKEILVKDKYLYSLNIKKGEFITIGMPIAIIQDISKAKLTIYLSDDEIKNLSKKRIYINGKKSNLKFNKIWKVADKEYISSYKAEIVLNPIGRFSKLLKVELK